MYFFSYLEPVCCSMSSSNCCFLTCIQISQEAGQVVWYSHLFQNFSQFIVIHTVKGFGIVNKAEIDVFLELSCFFHDPADVGNLISGSSTFSETSLNFHIIFHSDCTNLYSHQQCTRIHFSSQAHQHLLFLVIWIITISTSVRWYLMFCISLVISDVEHLSMCLLVICIFFFFFLEKCLFMSFSQFSSRFFFFWCWVVWVLCIFWMLIPYQIRLIPYQFANIFSHSVGSLFVLLVVSSTVQELLSLI